MQCILYIDCGLDDRLHNLYAYRLEYIPYYAIIYAAKPKTLYLTKDRCSNTSFQLSKVPLEWLDTGWVLVVFSIVVECKIACSCLYFNCKCTFWYKFEHTNPMALPGIASSGILRLPSLQRFRCCFSIIASNTLRGHQTEFRLLHVKRLISDYARVVIVARTTDWPLALADQGGPVDSTVQLL